MCVYVCVCVLLALGHAATDKTLLQKMTDQLKEQEALEIKPGGYAFLIKHYAGSIEYQIDGMLEKNKDPLPNQVCTVTLKSDA